MTFIRNNTIQAALISRTKSRANILVALKDTNEIRENQWKGTEFSYPNIRLDLTSNQPARSGCPQSIGGTFQVFSESPNSLEADNIAGIIVDELHDTHFVQSGLRFDLQCTNVRPAQAEGTTLWRSDIMFTGQVTLAS